MKKLLLTLALFLAANQSIQPGFASYFTKAALKKGVLCAGGLVGTGIGIETGQVMTKKYLGYGDYVSNEDLQLFGTKQADSFNALLGQSQNITDAKLAPIIGKLTALVPDPIPDKEKSLYQKMTESSLGSVVGLLLTGYGLLKWGVGEISQAYSLIGLFNSFKQTQEQVPQENSELRPSEQQIQRNRPEGLRVRRRA